MGAALVSHAEAEEKQFRVFPAIPWLRRIGS
jgi:hypothetical protein